jgi:hypothetical protein
MSHDHWHGGLCLLPDGRLASCSGGGLGAHDNTIRLWDPTTAAEKARLEAHSSDVRALCLLPDGRLASGSHASPQALMTRRSGFGTRKRTRPPASKGTPVRSKRCACCPTDASPRALMITRSGCGTRRRPPRPHASKATPVRSPRYTRCRMDASPRSLLTSRSGCGTRPRAPRRPASKGTPVRSPHYTCCQTDASPRPPLTAHAALGPDHRRRYRTPRGRGAIACLTTLPGLHLAAGDSLGRLHWLEVLTRKNWPKSVWQRLISFFAVARPHREAGPS